MGRFEFFCFLFFVSILVGNLVIVLTLIEMKKKGQGSSGSKSSHGSREHLSITISW